MLKPIDALREVARGGSSSRGLACKAWASTFRITLGNAALWEIADRHPAAALRLPRSWRASRRRETSRPR